MFVSAAYAKPNVRIIGSDADIAATLNGWLLNDGLAAQLSREYPRDRVEEAFNDAMNQTDYLKILVKI